MTTLLRSDELAAREFPVPTYLVDPILPAGGLALIYGKPGVGKTQFALTLAAAVNEGSILFDRWYAREGPVVIIQADMTSQMQQDRLAKILLSRKLPNTYFVVEEDGSTPLVDITLLKLSKPELVDAISELAPALVQWDTLRMIHPFPENSDESPRRVYGAAKKLFPLAAHTFYHHPRKQSRDPDAEEYMDEGFLGHQHWKSIADTNIYLEEVSTAPKRVKVQLTKARTASDSEKRPFIVELATHTMELVTARGGWG